MSAAVTYQILAVVVIVIGALVSTLCAGMLFVSPRDSPPFRRLQSFFGVIAGALVATGGGLISTYAWNLQSTAETRTMLAEASAARDKAEREAFVIGLAMELGTVKWLLTLPAFTERDPEAVKKATAVPSLPHATLDAFVSSPLFPDKEYSELRQAARLLVVQMSLLETILTQMRTAMLSGNAELTAVFRAKLPDAPQLAEVHDALRGIAVALDNTDPLKGRERSQELFLGGAWSYTKDVQGNPQLHIEAK